MEKRALPALGNARLDRTVVLPGNFTDDGQPQAATVATLPGRAIKAFEDPSSLVFGDPWTTILDIQPGIAIRFTAADRNDTAARCMTQGVVEQVAKQFLKQDFVPLDADWRELETEVDLLVDSLGQPAFSDLMDQGDQVDRS